MAHTSRGALACRPAGDANWQPMASPTPPPPACAPRGGGAACMEDAVVWRTLHAAGQVGAALRTFGRICFEQLLLLPFPLHVILDLDQEVATSAALLPPLHQDMAAQAQEAPITRDAVMQPSTAGRNHLRQLWSPRLTAMKQDGLVAAGGAAPKEVPAPAAAARPPGLALSDKDHAGCAPQLARWKPFRQARFVSALPQASAGQMNYGKLRRQCTRPSERTLLLLQSLHDACTPSAACFSVLAASQWRRIARFVEAR